MNDGRQNIQEEQSVRLIEGESTSNSKKVGSSAILCYTIDRIHEYIMCIDCRQIIVAGENKRASVGSPESNRQLQV
jgi:hypothetical protein